MNVRVSWPARELARLRHAEATETTPAVVVNDIEVNLRHLERRLEEMLRQALKIVRGHARLKKAFEHISSVRGIAAKSAVMILPEGLILPEEPGGAAVGGSCGAGPVQIPVGRLRREARTDQRRGAM